MKQYIINLLLSIAAILAPVKPMLITALVLVIVDLITGLVAAWKTKVPITSSNLKRTIVKGLVYESALVLGFIAQKYLISDAVPVVNIIAAFIGITELLSCLENLNRISGGDLLKTLIEKLNQTR